MDSQARHELSKAIQREGVVLFENPQRIKALLMDTCPESRMEIGLLIQAAEDDIPARLARSSESVFRDSEIARAVADLKKTRRLDDGAAEWVVRSWAWALGVLDTEPSDDVGDVGDATSVSPTPRSLSAGQAESPPYPSTPPSGPGDATSFPPAGSSSRSGPGPYTEPWQSSVTSGGQSANPVSGGLPWVAQPTVQGPDAGSWGSPPLPTNTGWGVASPPPPPGRGRGRLFAILGAVAAVIVLAVVGMAIFLNPGSPPAPPTPTSTDAGPGTIDFTITTSLANFEVAETTTVYSFGREVGKLQISTSQPNDSLAMVSEGTNVNYQLEITMIATNGKQYTITGTGTIAVYEGAVYAVTMRYDDAGNFWATLEPQQSGT